MEIDVDKMVAILKKEKPLNVTVVQQHGKDALVCMFTLPELADKVLAFGKDILGDRELIPLVQMTQEHFTEVFYAEGFAPSFIQTTIMQFGSLWGFHNAISKYGKFDTYRKVVDLGYDVEFKNK